MNEETLTAMQEMQRLQNEQSLQEILKLQDEQSRREIDTLQQMQALQQLMGKPKEMIRAEGEYSYEFQPEQAAQIEQLSKAIDILQERIEDSPKKEAVTALGVLGLLSTLATLAFKGKQ